MSDETTTTKTPSRRGPRRGSAEARRGGDAVIAKYGRDFFVKIGSKGGMTVARTLGADFYAAIGKKGGSETSRKHGAAFYAEIGRKGGLANRRGGDRRADA